MADNQFTPIPLTNYNPNPPPDDGQQTEANRGKYATIKEKLTDPMASIWDTLNTNISNAFLKTINIDPDQDNLVQGSIAYAPALLTVAAGAIVPTRRSHSIETEGGAATDDVETISTANLSDGAEIIVRQESAGHDLVFKHEAGGAGQIHLVDKADRTLADPDITLQFLRRGLDWYEIAATPAPAVPPVAFTEWGASPDQALPSNGALITVAYSVFDPAITGDLKELNADLVCVTAEHGYTAGQILPQAIQFMATGGVTISPRGLQIYYDDTAEEVYARIGQQGIHVLNASGALGVITLNRWTLRFKAKR